MPEHLFKRRGPTLRMVSTETSSEDDGQKPETPAYNVEPSWVDASGRTRTWALKAYGTQVAVITTKGAALKLAKLLNHADEQDPEPPPHHTGGQVMPRKIANSSSRGR